MRKLGTGWRRFQRIIPPADAPIPVDVATRTGLEAKVSDISEGGVELRYSSGEPPRPGDSMTLLLHLPQEAPVRARARVCHVDATRIGLTFTDLTPQGRESLRRYVQIHGAERSLWHRVRQLWAG